jgi:tripartite-type tricarboxylate transporter receptor subunit TctC
LAPAETPKEITTKLNQEMGRILQLPLVKDQLVKLGFEWQPNSTTEFSSFIQDEITRWADIVKTTGAQSE